MSSNAVPKVSSYATAWRGAAALRKHCHNVINILGPQTPPEAFLFRGNAYYALGKPYLALADYNIAASVLSISGAHQSNCLRTVKKFPEMQSCTYPSVDTHLHVYVEPVLSEKCEVRHVNDNRVGRGVFAKENIPRGAVVLQQAEPWLQYPLEEDSCAFCGKPLPERSFSCSNDNCHEEYCSRGCRTRALSTYHAAVCENQQYQRLELDMYAQMKQAEKERDTAARNAAAAELLTLRIITHAVSLQLPPTLINELRLLSGRLSFSPQVLCNGTLRVYERLVSSLHIATVLSYEEMIGVLARVTANCFQREHTIELYLARAMLNHSCNANVAEDMQSGELVATRGVARDEELCINYYPQLSQLPYEERTVELHRRGFHCLCPTCTQQRSGEQQEARQRPQTI